jgi:hypothetical protein
MGTLNGLEAVAVAVLPERVLHDLEPAEGDQAARTARVRFGAAARRRRVVGRHPAVCRSPGWGSDYIFSHLPNK